METTPTTQDALGEVLIIVKEEAKDHDLKLLVQVSLRQFSLSVMSLNALVNIFAMMIYDLQVFFIAATENCILAKKRC